MTEDFSSDWYKLAGLTPPEEVAPAMPTASTATVGRDADYAFGVTPWLPTERLKDRWLGDGLAFASEYESRFGGPPDYRAAAAVAAVEAFAMALEKAGTLEPKSVRDALAQVDFESLYGRVRFGADGQIALPQRVVQVQDGRLIESVIQHTAPLNPGNSGGPLLDSQGGMIGVNTAIIAYAQGLGFAVPATTADWVVSQLLTHGRVVRARLGLAGHTRPIDRRLARILGLVQGSVVEVLSVSERSPAARAGLRVGDWILALDGKPTSSIDALLRLLGPDQIGREASLSLVRGRERLTIEVTPERDAS